jgi:hypothetical protein
VTYRTIDALTNDAIFGGRVRACANEQADFFKDDTRPPFVALARDVILGGSTSVLVFVRLAAASPGMADQAGEGDDFDQAKITDADLLSIVQGDWELVATILFNDDGTAKERMIA